MASNELLAFPPVADAYTGATAIGVSGVYAGRRLTLGGRVITGSRKHPDGTQTCKFSRWITYERMVDGKLMEGMALVPESVILMSDVIQMCYTDSHRKGVSPRASNTGDRVINIEKVTTMSNDTSEYVVIPLTKGQVAIVSPEDAELAQFKWCACVRSNGAKGSEYKAARGFRINGKNHNVSMHSIVMSRILGRPIMPGEEVDHRDLNPLNNRRENLRLATHWQNGANQKLRKDNTSGRRGIHQRKDTGKWTAQICVQGKKMYLGQFDTAEEAYGVYCKAAAEKFGEFANFEEAA